MSTIKILKRSHWQMTFCGSVSADDSTGTYCWTIGVVSLFCQELTPEVENNLIFFQLLRSYLACAVVDGGSKKCGHLLISLISLENNCPLFLSQCATKFKMLRNEQDTLPYVLSTGSTEEDRNHIYANKTKYQYDHGYPYLYLTYVRHGCLSTSNVLGTQTNILKIVYFNTTND